MKNNKNHFVADEGDGMYNVFAYAIMQITTEKMATTSATLILSLNADISKMQ